MHDDFDSRTPFFATVSSCRLCGSRKLDPLLSLGTQAASGIFPKSPEDLVPQGPLDLVMCAGCNLVQLNHNFDQGLLYGDTYGYRSGLNPSMVSHLRSVVGRINALVRLDKGDVVLDIGSNDGTLLGFFEGVEVSLVGIDPLSYKFREFIPRTVHSVSSFFNQGVYFAAYKKRAKVITAFSMLYDLPSPLDFVSDVSDVLADDGVLVFEQSYVLSMVKRTAYDTICHEHLEYYSLKTICALLETAGLEVFDAELTDTNGGSLLVFAQKQGHGGKKTSPRVPKLLEKEVRSGINENGVAWTSFAANVSHSKLDVLNFFDKVQELEALVYGYGASTKGNTLLQYCGVGVNQIVAIADVNVEKHGSFTPGTLIPIISEEEAWVRQPDYLFVLPWHFREFFIVKERMFLQGGGELVFPLPRLEQVKEVQ